jgi:hypothetical protein
LGTNSIPPILSSAVICLDRVKRPGDLWLARCYLASPAPLRRDCTSMCCHRQRNPLALLPVARSPSRTHCCARWWALTPPFQPSPQRPEQPRGGNPFCCGCSQMPVMASALPYCFVRQLDPWQAREPGSREVPLHLYKCSDGINLPLIDLLSC